MLVAAAAHACLAACKDKKIVQKKEAALYPSGIHATGIKLYTNRSTKGQKHSPAAHVEMRSFFNLAGHCFSPLSNPLLEMSEAAKKMLVTVGPKKILRCGAAAHVNTSPRPRQGHWACGMAQGKWLCRRLTRAQHSSRGRVAVRV